MDACISPCLLQTIAAQLLCLPGIGPTLDYAKVKKNRKSEAEIFLSRAATLCK